MLGKREKSKYLFEDLNLDKIAIDMEHDLAQDSRKHQLVEDRTNLFGPNHMACNISKPIHIPVHSDDAYLQRIVNSSNFRTYYDEITMKNKLDFCVKIHIDFDQLTTKQEDIVYVSNKKYRCDRGLLFEIMEPLKVEEIIEIQNSHNP